MFWFVVFKLKDSDYYKHINLDRDNVLYRADRRLQLLFVTIFTSPENSTAIVALLI